MCQGFFFLFYSAHPFVEVFRPDSPYSSNFMLRTPWSSHCWVLQGSYLNQVLSCFQKNIYIYIKFILHSTNSKLKQAFSTKTFWRMTLNRFKKFSRVKYSMWKSSVGCCEEYVCGSGAPQLARSSVLGSCRSSRRFTWMLISNPDD